MKRNIKYSKLDKNGVIKPFVDGKPTYVDENDVLVSKVSDTKTKDSNGKKIYSDSSLFVKRTQAGYIDKVFVGDALFMPDFGTARCDLPGGSSENLFSSIQKILSLPDATRIFVGHDYKAPGREHYAWETTVGEQKKKNIHIKSGKSKEDFVKLRDERDTKLAMPKLIVPSLQINMRAGHMPEPDEKGDVFLKVPINKM